MPQKQTPASVRTRLRNLLLFWGCLWSLFIPGYQIWNRKEWLDLMIFSNLFLWFCDFMTRTPPPCSLLSSLLPCSNKQLWGRTNRESSINLKFLYCREVILWQCQSTGYHMVETWTWLIGDLSWILKSSDVSMSCSVCIKIESNFYARLFLLKTEFVIGNMTKFSCVGCN